MGFLGLGKKEEVHRTEEAVGTDLGKWEKELIERAERGESVLSELSPDEVEKLSRGAYSILYAKEMSHIHLELAEMSRRSPDFFDRVLLQLEEQGKLLERQREVIDRQNELLAEHVEKVGEANEKLDSHTEKLDSQNEKLDSHTEMLKEIQAGFRQMLKDQGEMILEAVGSLAKELKAVNEEGEIDTEKIKERLVTLEKMRKMLENSNFGYADEHTKNIQLEILKIVREIPSGNDMVGIFRQEGGAMVKAITEDIGTAMRRLTNELERHMNGIYNLLYSNLKEVEQSISTHTSEIARRSNPHSANVRW